jgi:hypothetical protein
VSEQDGPYTQSDVAEAKWLLKALGFSVVKTDRLERMADALHACIVDSHTEGYQDAFEAGYLLPGDLDLPLSE